MSEAFVTPAGEILKMFLDRKVRKYGVSEGPGTHYEILLRFDGNKPQGKQLRERVEEINKSLVGTSQVNKSGEFTIRARTRYEPAVFCANGNRIPKDEIPNFPSGSTGFAAIKIKPFTAKMGNGIVLMAVKLFDLQLSENEMDDSADMEDIRAVLLAS